MLKPPADNTMWITHVQFLFPMWLKEVNQAVLPLDLAPKEIAMNYIKSYIKT